MRMSDQRGQFIDPDFDGRFKECETCAGRAGSPTLCAGCLHNRDLIAVLQHANHRLHARLEAAVLANTIRHQEEQERHASPR